MSLNSSCIVIDTEYNASKNFSADKDSFYFIVGGSDNLGSASVTLISGDYTIIQEGTYAGCSTAKVMYYFIKANSDTTIEYKCRYMSTYILKMQ